MGILQGTNIKNIKIKLENEYTDILINNYKVNVIDLFITFLLRE